MGGPTWRWRVAPGVRRCWGGAAAAWCRLGRSGRGRGGNAGRAPGGGAAGLADGSASTVSGLVGNGDGTFGPNTGFGCVGSPFAVAIAGLNADGGPGLAVAGGGYAVSVLRGNGDGTFGPR